MGLPTGTVTLVFTDIEGSTRLLHALGERYGDALAEHRAIVRAAVAEHGGHEVDTQGDAFFLAFGSAASAVAAAVAIQRALGGHPWPDGHALRVRMGVHTGEPTPTAEGYVGMDLHRGARIGAVAHGGQVLVSGTTHALLSEGTAPAGVTLRDLGEHRLKDLTEAQHLFQVVADGLLTQFPAVRSLDAHPTNLPLPPTPLIGREAEVADVTARLLQGTTRLLTLTGPGGTGKTRLALEAAAGLVEELPDGVFLVELAAVSDPALVVPAIAQALAVRDGPDQSTAEALHAHLSGRRLLLLLDNLEQVLAAGRDVAALLAACPDLAVLATSREPLRVSGEQELPVAPLPAADATALFLARVRASRPDHEPAAPEVAAVHELCRRLDGLPLAIELAAARAKVLTPAALLARLDSRLRLLADGSSARPARHQTLRATLAWSHDLLEPDEQRLFARLAVFVDGWTLEAAEAACDPDGDLDVLASLASLVDKSLVHREEGDDLEPRFTMLETVRAYAVERFAEDPHRDAVRDAHAEHFAEAFWSGRDAFHDPSLRDVSRRLGREHGNRRAAMERLDETGSGATAFRLLVGSWRTFLRSGRLHEGRELFERALERFTGPGTEPMRSEALSTLGELHRYLGDFDAARRVKEEALPVLQLDAPVSAAYALADLGQIATDQHRYADAVDLLEQAARLGREHDMPALSHHTLCGLARLALFTGDLTRARELYAEEETVARAWPDDEQLQDALTGLGIVATHEGRLDEAETALVGALALAVAMDDLPATLDAVASLVGLAVVRGEHVRAAVLLGSVDHFLDSTGNQLWFPDERPAQREVLAAALGHDELEDALVTGAATGLIPVAAQVLAQSPIEMTPRSG